MNSAGSHQSRWREMVVIAALCLTWGALAIRLVQLQWFGRNPLAERADRQRSHVEPIPARPGEIVDRHGRLLATTITTRSLFLDPSRVTNPEQVALLLADALGIDPDELLNRMIEHRDKRFMWVKRRLTEDEAERIRQLNLPRESWGFRLEYQRRYPQGSLAAHVLGLRDIDGIGRGGIEQSENELLRGRDGRRILVRDARGKVIEVREEVALAPQHGRTIVLSIDAVIQLYTEQELDELMETWQPNSACAIVMDPRTGEVLAMASRPTFDPNRPIGVPPAAWKNTAVASIYEPGSTFKPFIVAWGLDKGLIGFEDTFHCEHGAYRMGRRVLHDHHPYGELSLTDVLVKSSNIGMAKIGERLTNAELHNAVVAFGFGRRTGIELPGELVGIVRPKSSWNGYSTGSIPMGQEIAVTPIQLITAQAALCNGGVLQSPRVVLTDVAAGTLPSSESGTEPTRPIVRSRLISREKALWVVQQPMTQVVRRGTGKNGQLDGYEVFGKTGTAQKVDPETGTYSHDRHVCSFICGAPADDPQILVLVVVDAPTAAGSHYGGTVAAPTAAEILQKTLVHQRVPHDRNNQKSLSNRADMTDESR